MTDHYVPDNPLERALQTERDYSQMLNEKLREAYAELDALRAEVARLTAELDICESERDQCRNLTSPWATRIVVLTTEVARLTATINQQDEAILALQHRLEQHGEDV